MKTNWKPSTKAINLIKKFEGYNPEPYKCPSGVLTIGYGTTDNVNYHYKQTKGMSAEDKQKYFEELLIEDVNRFGRYVLDEWYRINRHHVTQLNQNMFDALTSFCYNCGKQNLGRLIDGRNKMEIANMMPEYNKGNFGVLEGLTKRRKEERKLFITTKHSSKQLEKAFNICNKKFGNKWMNEYSVRYLEACIYVTEEGFDWNKLLIFARTRKG